MGSQCTTIPVESLPNFKVLCLQAVQYELSQRLEALNKELTIHAENKSKILEKAKSFVLDNKQPQQQIFPALLYVKAVLRAEKVVKDVEDTKLEMEQTIKQIDEEILKEKTKKLDHLKIKEQNEKNLLVEFRKIAEKYIGQFETGTKRACYEIEILNDISYYSKLTPVEQYKKLKEEAENISVKINESYLKTVFDPRNCALKVTEKFLSEKTIWLAEIIDQLKSEKDECLKMSNNFLIHKQYATALISLKSVELYNEKLAQIVPIEKSLKEDVEELQGEIVKMQSEDPVIQDLESALSRPAEEIVFDAMSFHVKKEQALAMISKVSPVDLLNSAASEGKYEGNLELIIKAINDMKMIEPILIESVKADVGKKIGEGIMAMTVNKKEDKNKDIIKEGVMIKSQENGILVVSSEGHKEA